MVVEIDRHLFSQQKYRLGKCSNELDELTYFERNESDNTINLQNRRWRSPEQEESHRKQMRSAAVSQFLRTS